MAGEPKNIEDFKVMVGTILGGLYEIHPGEIAEDAESFFDEEEIDNDRMELFGNTVNYLVRGGYLHRSSQFFLQLTPASWDVLQKPDPLSPKQTIGKTLYSWAKTSSGEIARAQALELVGSTLQMVWKLIEKT